MIGQVGYSLQSHLGAPPHAKTSLDGLNLRSANINANSGVKLGQGQSNLHFRVMSRPTPSPDPRLHLFKSG